MSDAKLQELKRLWELGDEAALDPYLRELARAGLIPGERWGRFQLLQGAFPVGPAQRVEWLHGWDHERGYQVLLNVRGGPAHAHFARVVDSFATLGHPRLRVPEWISAGGACLLAVERRGPDLSDPTTWAGVPRERRLEWIADAASTLSDLHEAGRHFGGVPFEFFQVGLDGSVSLGGLERLGMEPLDPQLTGANNGLPPLDIKTAATPEAVSQQGCATDARTDVWSLGLLLARALADRFLHAEGADTAVDLCRRVAADPHPTLKVADPSIPDALDWVALCALEREQDRRYPTAGAFVRDLERALGGGEVEAGPPLHLQGFFPRALERIRRLGKG